MGHVKYSGFVHLHLHTQYSLLDGMIRPDELFALAREFKMQAVAMTDHANLFGAVKFYEKALKAGIKPIIGCEVYIAPVSMPDRAFPSNGQEEPLTHHLVLLIENLKGYQNLCGLLTRAYTEGVHSKPRVDKALLKEFNEGLIALSACLHGEVASHILAGRRALAVEAAREYSGIFPDRRFFLEIQANGLEGQKMVNTELISISREINIPLVATNNCHYLKKEDSKCHDILLCIQTGKTINSTDRKMLGAGESYFKSPEEMTRTFKDVPDAVANTIEIAERCNLELCLGQLHLPDFPVPEGETLDSCLDSIAAEGLERRLKVMGERGEDVKKKRQVYYNRLRKELTVIKRMGISSYFLVVSDFIDYARGRLIPVGPGRGSSAGSLVAYALGMTNIDPIHYNLLFERFLNPDRANLPDIDIDLCCEGREEVMRYVTEKYGINNVAQIITFAHMRAKAVIRDVGRALDMSFGEVDRVAKLVPNISNITINYAIKQENGLKELIDKDAKVRELINIAKTLEGLPRHASTHAAGIVISKKPLEKYLPLYRHKDGLVSTQYSMEDIAAIGLVKFNFLGIKTLTVIGKTVSHLKENMGIAIDLDAIPLDDPDTYALISSGNTDGIFQLESKGIRKMLKRLKPGSFEDLIAAVALYRPGPLQSGMVDNFITRKHSKTPIRYEFPQLKKILENTYGVILYQEQVMEIARTIAGYSYEEADILRRVIGKMASEEIIEQLKKFLKGAKKKKSPSGNADHIFDFMIRFANFAFLKSHSAAYALIAYQTAYLKAHYPAEFMAAFRKVWEQGNS